MDLLEVEEMSWIEARLCGYYIMRDRHQLG
jgi:hypothetical protein